MTATPLPPSPPQPPLAPLPPLPPLPPTAPTTTAATLRPAEPADLPAIVGLITELAEFEHLSHLMQATPETLAPHLFGPRPAAEAVVAELDGRVVGFALFFTNFSTFLARPGLYLEDLYVQPAHRQHGIGKALLRHLGALAVARGCGRFEWSVLDWNANAIAFYEKMGATVMPDWRICRISGAALQAYAPPAGPDSPVGPDAAGAPGAHDAATVSGAPVAAPPAAGAA